ncbi:MAG: Pr6Pr family membrane protein [Pseudomonadota bacterium]
MRLVAGLIAVGVAAALAVRFSLTMDEKQIGLLGAMWSDYRFFTIWANTLVGVVCVGLALGRAMPQWVTAGMALAIALVAGVYHALLAEGRNLQGLDWAVDLMVHTIIPAAYIGLWLVALPKNRLGWRDLLIWAALPLVYSVYAIGRGAVDGVYPYFFLNVTNLGAAGVAAWVAGLAGVFLVAGAGMVLSVKARSLRS